MLKYILKTSVISIPIITSILAIILNNEKFIKFSLILISSNFINITLKIIFGLINYKFFLRPNSKYIPFRDRSLSDYIKNIGMPSGHSQLSFLFSTFLILYIINKNIYNINKISVISKIILLLVFSISISVSRLGIIKNLGPQVHSIFQVVIGGIIGIIIGFLTFKVL